MLVGLGHDLQALGELSGVEGLWEPGPFLTETEVARARAAASPLERLAATFAAKEALFKALPPTGGWFWTDAELTHDARHAPHFRFHGALREQVERERWEVRVSLSHSGGFASAVVLVWAAGRA